MEQAIEFLLKQKIAGSCYLVWPRCCLLDILPVDLLLREYRAYTHSDNNSLEMIEDIQTKSQHRHKFSAVEPHVVQ